jgi:hypothetical protein
LKEGVLIGIIHQLFPSITKIRYNIFGNICGLHINEIKKKGGMYDEEKEIRRFT